MWSSASWDGMVGELKKTSTPDGFGKHDQRMCIDAPSRGTIAEVGYGSDAGAIRHHRCNMCVKFGVSQNWRKFEFENSKRRHRCFRRHLTREAVQSTSRARLVSGRARYSLSTGDVLFVKVHRCFGTSRNRVLGLRQSFWIWSMLCTAADDDAGATCSNTEKSESLSSPKLLSAGVSSKREVGLSKMLKQLTRPTFSCSRTTQMSGKFPHKLRWNDRPRWQAPKDAS